MDKQTMTLQMWYGSVPASTFPQIGKEKKGVKYFCNEYVLISSNFFSRVSFSVSVYIFLAG